MVDPFPIKITKSLSHTISIEQFGLYAISITARCQGKWFFGLRKEQNLRLEINGTKFREIPPEKNTQLWKIPPAWNGIELKGLSKTVVLLLPLNVKDYTFTFFAEPEATIEKFTYKLLLDLRNITFDLNEQAEDGDRRPWYTFSFIDLPLLALKADISTQWHFLDGDDVKLIIDNRIKPNPESKKHHDWVWSAKPALFSKPKREEKTFTENLPAGVHYLEFWADKNPTLHKVSFDLGDFIPKRTPTVKDPEWTGDFGDDTDQMILARLIFGEARNQSSEAMIGVAWTVKNRLQAKRKYFGFNYHEIIQKNDGRYYQFSSFNPAEEDNFPLLIHPLKNNNEVDRQKWLTSYEVAGQVISDKIQDPTQGATCFHSQDLSQEKFVTKSVPGAIYLKTIGSFLFYQDPNEIKK